MYQDKLPLESNFKNRFTISTITFFGYEPVSERALTRLASAGIKGIEVLESPDQCDLTNQDAVKGLLEDARSAGVTIDAFHAHCINFGSVRNDKELRAELSKCYQQLDNLELCGGSFWACHIHHENPVTFKAMEALGKFIENRPLKIGVENFVGPGMWIHDRLNFVEKLDHPQIGMLLDIGHVRNLDLENPMTLSGQAGEVIRLFKDRLFHLHLHGFIDGVDHYPPFSEGDEIQWREIFSALAEIDYKGLYNFEPKARPNQIESIELTGHFYRNLLMT